MKVINREQFDALDMWLLSLRVRVGQNGGLSSKAKLQAQLFFGFSLYRRRIRHTVSYKEPDARRNVGYIIFPFNESQRRLILSFLPPIRADVFEMLNQSTEEDGSLLSIPKVIEGYFNFFPYAELLPGISPVGLAIYLQQLGGTSAAPLLDNVLPATVELSPDQAVLAAMVESGDFDESKASRPNSAFMQVICESSQYSRVMVCLIVPAVIFMTEIFVWILCDYALDQYPKNANDVWSMFDSVVKNETQFYYSHLLSCDFHSIRSAQNFAEKQWGESKNGFYHVAPVVALTDNPYHGIEAYYVLGAKEVIEVLFYSGYENEGLKTIASELINNLLLGDGALPNGWGKTSKRPCYTSLDNAGKCGDEDFWLGNACGEKISQYGVNGAAKNPSCSGLIEPYNVCDSSDWKEMAGAFSTAQIDVVSELHEDLLYVVAASFIVIFLAYFFVSLSCVGKKFKEKVKERKALIIKKRKVKNLVADRIEVNRELLSAMQVLC